MTLLILCRKRALLLLLAVATPIPGFASPHIAEQNQQPNQTQSQAQSAGAAEVQNQLKKTAGEEELPTPGSSFTITSTSLGEFARRERAERAKNPTRAPRIFTNDNLPKSAGGVSIVGPPAGEEPVALASGGNNESAARLRDELDDLRGQLETHQRELAVLQQKLGENQVQYYPNPNDTLHQEYSRQDIDRLRLAIEQKQAQIQADHDSISGAEDALANPSRATGGAVAGQKPAAESKPAANKASSGSEQYWRERFKAAREALAKAQEQQKLAEDELSLLQSQQAHEIASGSAGAFDPQISSKQTEIESDRQKTAQAQHDLDSLEEEFSKSGSPQDWSD